MTEEDVQTFYSHGSAQYGSGRWNEAAEIFRVLCTHRPYESKFWFGLGATLQMATHYREALQSWAMAALLNDKDPFAHFHAAECYFSLNEPIEGKKALEAADTLSQAHPQLKKKTALLRERWEWTHGN